MQCNQHHAFEVVLAYVRLYVYYCFGTAGSDIREPVESEYEDGGSVCRVFFYLSFCKRKWNFRSMSISRSSFLTNRSSLFVS